uniref:WxxW domain-containing protein n=1 Tax=Sinocyclocheilus grahami TaxID=75366 RepID=A0A672LAL5_SINGR
MRRLYLVGFPLLECRTPWFDRDDPSGLGDNEKLSLLLIRYPLQVCTQPIAIEVTTVSGSPWSFFWGLNFFFSVLYSLACVTRWFDSDNPETNGGDSELLTFLLNKYPGEICPNPLGIEAQTISNHVLCVFCRYNPTTGFSCLNANQGGGVCADYKVRFTCPEDWCSSECMTPWFDRDDPSGLGDNEKLSLLLIRYPLQVCTQPIAIEVTTVSGSPVLPPGNNFVVYNPVFGFACVNAGQTGGGLCADYKVRFSCPAKFCASE